MQGISTGSQIVTMYFFFFVIPMFIALLYIAIMGIDHNVAFVGRI
jgi:hypothetical protein